jgi:hypothetical protein
LVSSHGSRSLWTSPRVETGEPISTHTPSKPKAAQHAQDGAETVARSDSFEWLARAGFIARGLVYVIVGILAVQLAAGGGGKAASQQGAMKAIAAQPFGRVLLVVVAIGLGGYAMWRLTRALLGHGREGSDTSLERVAALGSGIVYAGLCAVAVEIALGAGSSASSGAQKTTAGVFSWPAGTWLVGIAGAALIGIGLYQGYRGLSTDFLEDSKTEQMSARVRRWITWIGTIGHLARMVVFGLIGTFLIKAAVDYNSNAAVGLDGALAKVAHQSYGPLLLGLVAAGLVAFGLYSLTDARYRRI